MKGDNHKFVRHTFFFFGMHKIDQRTTFEPTDKTSYFFLDRRLLLRGVDRLSTVISSANESFYNHYNCKYPQEYVRVLICLLFFYSMETEDYEAQEEVNPAESKYKKKKQKKMTRFFGADSKLKTEIGIRRYHDKNDAAKSVTAWMFIFRVLDDQLNIDKEINEWLKTLPKKQANKKMKLVAAEKPEVPDHLELCSSREQWITEYLTKFDKDLALNEQMIIKALHISPTDDTYPIFLHQVFSAEKASTYNVDGYVPFEDEYFVLRTGFITAISDFMNFCLTELHSEPVPKSIKNLTDVLEIAKYQVKKIKNDPSKNFEDYIHSAEYNDLFESVMMGDEEHPGSVIAHKWFHEEVQQARITTEKYFIGFREKRFGKYPKQTIFGNLIALDLIGIEHLLKYRFLHEEILLVLNAALSFGEISRSLRYHLVISGGSSIGKSFIWRSLEDCTIPGLIIHYSAGTGNAHTNESNWNNHIVVIDELPQEFLNAFGGQGDTILKEMLTQQAVTKYRSHVEKETGKTVLVPTVCKRGCSLLSSTNEPFSKLVDSMNTRFNKFHAIYIDREYPYIGMSDHDKECEEFKYRNMQRQALVNQVWKKIYLGVFEPIDMTISDILFSMVETILKKHHGVRVETRDKERIESVIRTLVVKYAVDVVFFTKPRPADYDFSPNDLLDCRPYLFCTREIFWYALSNSKAIIFSPFIHLFMKGFHVACTDGDTSVLPDRFELTVKSADGNKEYTACPNYYFLKVQCSNQKQNISSIISNEISNAIARTTDARLAPEIVGDILILLSSKLTPDAKNARCEIPSLAVETSFFKPGLKVAVSLFEKYIHSSAVDPMEEVIRETMDKYTPDYDYLLGYSNRFEKFADSDPHIFKTIISKSKISTQDLGNNRQIDMPNPLYKSEDFIKFIENRKVTTEDRKKPKKIPVESNLDEMVYKKLMAKYKLANIPTFTQDPTEFFDFS